MELPRELAFEVPVLNGESLAVLSLESHFFPTLFWPSDPADLHRLQLALFDDGTLIWRVEHGKSFAYLRARVPDETVARTLQELEPVLAAVPRAEWCSWGPDSPYDSVTLRTARGTVRFESWHNDDPASPRVANQHGLFARQGRSNEELEREWTSEYRAFRSAWSQARASLEGLRPAEGAPLDSRAVDLRMLREPAYGVSAVNGETRLPRPRAAGSAR